MLDLTPSCKEGFVAYMKVEGCLCCGDRGIVEFRIPKVRRKVRSNLTTLNFM